MKDLIGCVAIVTGSAGGLGRGIALVLGREGASVVIADMNEDAAKKAAAEVSKLGNPAWATRMDVTSIDSVESCVADVMANVGKVDILVNNAGVMGAPGWTETQDGRNREEDWDVTFNVNVKGMMHACEAVIPHMVERRVGKIVNIASAAARRPKSTFAWYSTSKAAVVNYTESLALRLAPYSINVNAVCPGLIWTPMWTALAGRFRNIDPDRAQMDPRDLFLRDVENRVPLKREQTPEDIGNLVAFLASENARNITAQAIFIDGGVSVA